MCKKTHLFIVPVMLLAALFLLPAVSFAAPHKAYEGTNATKSASFAFTGLIHGTKIAITGGLTLDIRDNGQFTGNFKLPEGPMLPVNGEIKHDGKLTINFTGRNGKPYVKGQGDVDKMGEYTGPFQVFDMEGKQVASGKWSALPVTNPDDVLAFAFTGRVTKGTDNGLFLPGAIVLNKSSLKGHFNEPDGTIVPVMATLSDNGKQIKVVFDLSNGKTITGNGSQAENKHTTGYKGTYSGPAANDEGEWEAFAFKF